MASPSPFPFLDSLADRLAQVLVPPPWLEHELRHRLVLLANHVLLQEPQAQVRLARHAGSVVEATWRQSTLRLAITPPGLLELADDAATAQLTLALTEDSPFALAAAGLRGERPALRISGDVQFAADIHWVSDNVRWDLEEDLARLLGDAPAHALGEAARAAAAALRRFVGERHASASASPGTPEAAPKR